MRLPVAAKIALQSAGATGGSGGSPTPPHESARAASRLAVSSFDTITVSTFGMPSMRSIG